MRNIKAEAISVIVKIRKEQDILTKANRKQGLKEFENVVMSDTATTDDIYEAAVKARDLVNNASRLSFGIFGKSNSVYLCLLNGFIETVDQHYAEEQAQIDRLATQALASQLLPKSPEKPSYSEPKRIIREDEVREQLDHHENVMRDLHKTIETFPNCHLHSIVHDELKKVANFDECPSKFNVDVFVTKAREFAKRLNFNQYFGLQKLVREYNSLCDDKKFMAYYSQEVHSNNRTRKSDDRFRNCLHNVVASATTPRFT